MMNTKQQSLIAERFKLAAQLVATPIHTDASDIITRLGELNVAIRDAQTVVGSVLEYFEQKLGAHCDDRTLNELEKETTCGRDCVEAIDAACEMLLQIKAGFGTDRESYRLSVIEICQDIVATYWSG